MRYLLIVALLALSPALAHASGKFETGIPGSDIPVTPNEVQDAHGEKVFAAVGWHVSGPPGLFVTITPAVSTIKEAMDTARERCANHDCTIQWFSYGCAAVVIGKDRENSALSAIGMSTKATYAEAVADATNICEKRQDGEGCELSVLTCAPASLNTSR